MVYRLREIQDAAENEIIELIMKNPRLLISKTYDPTIYRPGMHSNIVHILCQVTILTKLFL